MFWVEFFFFFVSIFLLYVYMESLDKRENGVWAVVALEWRRLDFTADRRDRCNGRSRGVAVDMIYIRLMKDGKPIGRVRILQPYRSYSCEIHRSAPCIDMGGKVLFEVAAAVAIQLGLHTRESINGSWTHGRMDMTLFGPRSTSHAPSSILYSIHYLHYLSLMHSRDPCAVATYRYRDNISYAETTAEAS